MRPDLTISIINHSNPAMLQNCLCSLYSSTHDITFEVWVIDNATGGRLVSEIRAQFPQVQWILSEKRQGFSANHNQVLHQAKGRYACILNDDTVVHEGAFDNLVHFMDANPQVGMVGAKLLNADGSVQNCTFRFMTLISALVNVCFLPERLCFLKARDVDKAQYQEHPARVDWVLGACVLVRDKVLKEVGLLDSALSPIVYMEEVDWCRRAHQAGWEVAYCPAATITHLGGQSTQSSRSGVDGLRVELFRTHIAYFRKHHGHVKTALLRLIYSLTLPWNVLMLTQSLVRGRLELHQYKRNLSTFCYIALMSLFPDVQRHSG